MPAMDSDMRRKVASCVTIRPIAAAVAVSGFGPAVRTISRSSLNSTRKRSGALRSKASSLVTCFHPLPSSPSRQSSGTNRSVRKIWLKWCSPNRLMTGLMSIPGDFRSTRNCVAPAWRSASSPSRAILQNRIIQSDWCAFEVQSLVPLTR